MGGSLEALRRPLVPAVCLQGAHARARVPSTTAAGAGDASFQCCGQKVALRRMCFVDPVRQCAGVRAGVAARRPASTTGSSSCC